MSKTDDNLQAAFAGESQANRLQTEVRRNSGFAIASLAMGLVSFTCIPSLLAVVFGFIALAQIAARPTELKGRAMAILGIALGIIFMIATVIIVMFCGLPT